MMWEGCSVTLVLTASILLVLLSWHLKKCDFWGVKYSGAVLPGVYMLYLVVGFCIYTGLVYER
jgi:hypothetical protein